MCAALLRGDVALGGGSQQRRLRRHMRYIQRCSPRCVFQPGPTVGAAASLVARLCPPPTCVRRWTRRAFVALVGAHALSSVAVEVHNFTSCRGAVKK